MCAFLVAQFCLTRVTPIHGILQARILEWIAISFSGHMTKPSWELKCYPCDFKFCALLNVFAFFIFKQQIAYLFILNKILKQTSERDKSSSSPSVASPWHLCSMHQLNNYSISYGSFFYKSTPSKKTQSKNILTET